MADNARKVKIGPDGEIYIEEAKQSGGSSSEQRPNPSSKSGGGCFSGCFATLFELMIVCLLVCGVSASLTDCNAGKGDSSHSSSSGNTYASNSADDTQEESSTSHGTKNDSHYDATTGSIRLSGTITREERLRQDTGMGWSAVVYWLALDESVRITYVDGFGSETTNTFSRIAVYALEQYGDDADVGLDDITDSYWQSYVGKTVTVEGSIVDTGNAHTFGYANLGDARVVS